MKINVPLNNTADNSQTTYATNPISEENIIGTLEVYFFC